MGLKKSLLPGLATAVLIIAIIPLASSSTVPSPPASSPTTTYRAPDWVMNAIFYQIMVDRFYNGDPSNDPDNSTLLLRSWTNINNVTFPDLYARKMSWTDDVETDVLWPDDYGNMKRAPTLGRDYYGGDFQGVKMKIPYLENLGITAIYFNPIHDGPHFHGYTIENYESANRFYGGMTAFVDMISSLKQKNIRVILDGVFNHTSCTHPWFDRENRFADYLGAYESQNSPYYSWYTFYQWPLNYRGWSNFSHVPELNPTDGYKNYLYRGQNSLLKYWNDIGIDGWRLDLAMQIKDRFGWGFWREFSQALTQINPEGYLVAEPDHGPAPQPDYVTQGYLDGVMNYAWMRAVIDWVNGNITPSSFASRLSTIKNAFPADAFYTQLNILSSHDDHRLRTQVGGRTDRVKLAAIFQMTYPGAPCIWYGDEVGMTSDYPRGSGTVRDADPFTRRPFPWPEMGYPVSGQPDVPNWDIFSTYQKMISIRKSYQVLRTGTVETLMTNDAARILALFRKLPNPDLPRYSGWRAEYAVLVYNTGSSPQSVTLDLTGKIPNGTKLVDVLNGNEEYTVTNNRITLTVENMWAAVLVYTSNQPPVADFTFSPSSPTVGETVEFTDSSRDPDGTVVSWSWDFGDGTTSNERNPTKLYSSAGTYTVRLTVTDDGGLTATASKTVTVSRAPQPGKRSTTLRVDPASFTLVSGETKLLTAILRDNENNPVAGRTITWSASAGTISPQSSQTDSSGRATATYTAPTVTVQTSATITASFAGDDQHTASSGQSSAVISPGQYSLDISPIPEVVPGSSLILRGRVLDQAGNPIPGATIKVLINGQLTSTVTAGGDGSFSLPVTLPAGQVNLELQAFSGDVLVASLFRSVQGSAEAPGEEPGLDVSMVSIYGGIALVAGLLIGFLAGRRISAGRILSLSLAALLLLSLVPAVMAPSRTVDGSASDWTGTPPTTINTPTVSNGEFIWKDNQGDERTDLNNWQPDRRVDLLEFRVTADTSFIYFMAKMTDIDVGSGDGAPCIQVAVDTDRVAGSGVNWFGLWSDTMVSDAARWERLVCTRFGSGTNRVYVFNTNWENLATADDTAAISTANDVIEFRVGWSRLGVSPPCTLRFSVVTHRQATNDDAVEVYWSDVLDVMTTASPNTWNEVWDNVVDYYVDVSFDSAGNVTWAGLTSAVDGNVWWSGVLHDQDNSFYFSPLGNTTVLLPLMDRGRKVPCNQDVTVRLRANENDLSEAWLRVWRENTYENRVIENVAARFQMTKEGSDGTYDYWRVTLPAQGRSGRVWYRFYLVDNGRTGSYSWDTWQNPTSIGTEVDIDSYADDTFPRSGGQGKMYDFPKTRTEPDTANDPIDNYDFLIIFYENIPPTKPSLQSPENGILLAAAPTLRWTASTDPEPSSGLGYRLQISRTPDFSSPILNTFTGENSASPTLQEGAYYWRVRAEDYDGNYSDWTDAWFFRLDLGPPSAPSPVYPPENLCTRENSITFRWSEVQDASPPVLYRLSISDNLLFPHENFSSGWIQENSWQVELPEGIWFWRICARDNLGNMGENSRTFRLTIDRTPPAKPAIIRPENGASVNVRRPTLVWGAVTDPSTPVTYDVQLSASSDFSQLIVDNSGLLENSLTLRTDLEERTYYWRVRARDNAGNASEWSIASFVVDLTALPAPANLSPTGFTNSRRPTLRWDPVQSPFTLVYVLELDDSSDFSSPIVVENSLTETSYQLGVDLPDGTYYWRVRARTEFKVGQATQASFVVDTVPPAKPQVLTSLPAATRVRRWLIAGTAEASARVQCFVNDSPVAENVAENGSFSLWVSLPTGNVSVKLRAVDPAGNSSEFTQILVVRVLPGWGAQISTDRIPAGVERSFAFAGYQMSLQEVRVRAKQEIAWPIIYAEEFLPWDNAVEIPRPKGSSIYRLIYIEQNFSESAVSGVSISFRLELGWLRSRGISERDMRLLRYDGGWREVSTRFAGIDQTYAYYEAEAGGLSWFAIATAPSIPLLSYAIMAALGVAGLAIGFLLGSGRLLGRKRRGRT